MKQEDSDKSNKETGIEAYITAHNIQINIIVLMEGVKEEERVL